MYRILSDILIRHDPHDASTSPGSILLSALEALLKMDEDLKKNTGSRFLPVVTAHQRLQRLHIFISLSIDLITKHFSLLSQDDSSSHGGILSEASVQLQLTAELYSNIRALPKGQLTMPEAMLFAKLTLCSHGNGSCRSPVRKRKTKGSESRGSRSM